MFLLMQPKSEIMFEHMASILKDRTKKLGALREKSQGQLSIFFDCLALF